MRYTLIGVFCKGDFETRIPTRENELPEDNDAGDEDCNTRLLQGFDSNTREPTTTPKLSHFLFVFVVFSHSRFLFCDATCRTLPFRAVTQLYSQDRQTPAPKRTKGYQKYTDGSHDMCSFCEDLLIRSYSTRMQASQMAIDDAVSYTHLTLPTNREV